jgi:putative transposase
VSTPAPFRPQRCSRRAGHQSNDALRNERDLSGAARFAERERCGFGARSLCRRGERYLPNSSESGCPHSEGRGGSHFGARIGCHCEISRCEMSIVRFGACHSWARHYKRGMSPARPGPKVRRAKGQLSLAFPNRWGGARRGAGRKPGPRPKTAHRIRPTHRGWQPVHVTLRAGFRMMRSESIFGAVERAFRRSLQRAPEHFRVLQFSIQSDHVHLIVEAASNQALSRGMQGLSVSIARRVNRLLGRRGRFWADRFHARALENPRSVRSALVYVLANFRKHATRRYPAGIDRFSSAPLFDGWRLTLRERTAVDQIAAQVFDSGPVVAHARTWLARVGWRRHGPISLTEEPARPG